MGDDLDAGLAARLSLAERRIRPESACAFQVRRKSSDVLLTIAGMIVLFSQD